MNENSFDEEAADFPQLLDTKNEREGAVGASPKINGEIDEDHSNGPIANNDSPPPPPAYNNNSTNLKVQKETEELLHGSHGLHWRISFPTYQTGDGKCKPPPHQFVSQNLVDLERMLMNKKILLTEQIAEMKSRQTREFTSSWQCGSCWLLLGSQVAYDNHISVCPLVCLTCGELFNDSLSYKFHMSKRKVEGSCSIGIQHSNSCECDDKICNCAMCV